MIELSILGMYTDASEILVFMIMKPIITNNISIALE
jgi:hypothetical protein